MNFDTVTNIALLGCFLCLVSCVAMQTFLQWYGERCKGKWVEKTLNIALLQAADNHIKQIEDEWNGKLDAGL
jgi:hypothetical protein